jgi:hypothetical protein
MAFCSFTSRSGLAPTRQSAQIIIEAPWLVNGGHGASLAAVKLFISRGLPSPAVAHQRQVGQLLRQRGGGGGVVPVLDPARPCTQYFWTRTGVTQVNLSQYGPIPRWERPAHSTTSTAKRRITSMSSRSSREVNYGVGGWGSPLVSAMVTTTGVGLPPHTHKALGGVADDSQSHRCHNISPPAVTAPAGRSTPDPGRCAPQYFVTRTGGT